MERRVIVNIGDWSEDGHNQYEQIVYEVNYSVEQIRQAYKDSCKLTGLQFNHKEDYTGLYRSADYDARKIWTGYEESSISPLAQSILANFGLKVSHFTEDVTPEEGANLILDFIKLSLPNLSYEEASYKRSELNTIPNLNGFWNRDLNVQFGYGLFTDL